MTNSPQKHERRNEAASGGGRLVTIFERACELAGEDREAYLRSACGDDEALRNRVERLLEADEKGGTFLAQPILSGAAELLAAEAVRLAGAQAASTKSPPMPDRLGQYEIETQIGEGSTAVVYRGVGRHPQRDVAIKVLRSEGLSPTQRARMRWEANTIARLNHPGIAAIYEAHDDGVSAPYHVLEFVKGQTLIEYASSRDLDVQARLELVLQVCDAVQFAHMKGVIHRDLKPANILITDEGQIKILDFGIARPIGDGASVAASGSEIAGSAPYMSPEQCGAAAGEIDARSDVYAIGVLLYELLSGRLPIDVRSKPWNEARAMILAEDPIRLGDLHRELRGDLEAITLKAFAKDPGQRYQSAAALADDIRRYLHIEPVSARPRGALYTFGKFARRRRGIVLVFALMIASLVAGIIGTSLGQARARAAEARQREIAASEREARMAAEQQEALARERLQTIAQVLGFIDDDVFGAADPYRALGQDYTVRQMVADAARRLSGRFDDPIVEAMLHQSLGTLLRKLGDREAAEHHVRRAAELFDTGPKRDKRSALVARANLASLLDEQGKVEEAGLALRQTLAAMRVELGEEDQQTLMAAGNAAIHLLRTRQFDEAIEILEWLERVQRRIVGERDLAYLNTLSLLASALGNSSSRSTEAEAAFRRAAAAYKAAGFPDRFPPRLTMLHNFALHLRDSGREAAAAEVLQEVIRYRRIVLPDRHPHTIQSIEVIGGCFEAMGNFGDAADSYAEALEACRARGEAAAQCVPRAEQLIATYVKAGRRAEAEAFARSHHKECHRLFGPCDEATVQAVVILADLVAAQSQAEEATALLSHALHEFDGEGCGDEAVRSMLIRGLTAITNGAEGSEVGGPGNPGR